MIRESHWLCPRQVCTPVSSSHAGNTAASVRIVNAFGVPGSSAKTSHPIVPVVTTKGVLAGGGQVLTQQGCADTEPTSMAAERRTPGGRIKRSGVNDITEGNR